MEKKKVLGLCKKDKIAYISPTVGNKHILAVGGSGGGKSFAMICLVIQEAKSGGRVLCINWHKTLDEDTVDPVLYKEYSKLVTIIDVKSEGLPIDIFKPVEDSNGTPEDEDTMILRITALLADVCKLSPSQRGMLRRAVQAVIRDADGTKNPYQEIIRWFESQQKATAYAAAAKLLPLCGQGLFREGELLSDKTPITEINLNNLERDQQLLFLHCIIDHISRLALRGAFKGKPIRLFLDEVQSLSFGDDEPITVLLGEARKTDVNLSLACPSIYTSTKKDRDILMQAGTRLFFRCLDSERNQIAELLDSEDVGTMNYLLSSLEVGQCVVKGDIEIDGEKTTKPRVVTIVHPTDEEREDADGIPSPDCDVDSESIQSWKVGGRN